MRVILQFFSFICLFTAGAQKPISDFNQTPLFMNDAYGRPIAAKATMDTEGSIFFKDHYQLATVTMNRKTYLNIPVKINLAENQVLFNYDGIEMAPMLAINKIAFYDSLTHAPAHIFKTGFPAMQNIQNETLLEVLDSGKVVLLKHVQITSRDERPYNSAVTTRVYKKVPAYYFYFGNKLSEVSRKQENLLMQLQGKTTELEAFVRNNKIKLNKEEDVLKMVRYYNSLH